MSLRTEFDPIFYPKSIAVIGASANPMKFGGGFLSALQQFGYKGKIYPVNPQGTEILGLKMYPNVKDIPDPVDLAYIMVPSHIVPKVLEDCLAKGIKGAQILTAGFRETGEEEGKKLEAEIVKIAQKGIRIVGPNCFGVYCPSSGLTLLPGYDFPKESGPVAFLSQSGGYAAEICNEARAWGIRFSKVISYGNACDLNETHYLEYLAEDPETKIIAAYMEGPRDGPRFFRLVQEISKTKPIVIWKGGLTKAGSRAVSSHTASLAGEEAIWNALFRQTAAIRVSDLEELIDTVVALTHLPKPEGREVGVVSGGGGISVAASDVCELAGLSVTHFSQEIQQQLKRILPSAGTGVRNPVDVGAPIVMPDIFQHSLEITSSAPNAHSIIATQAIFYLHVLSKTLGAFFPSPDDFIQTLLDIPVNVKKECNKPIVMVLPVGSPEAVMVDAEKTRREAMSHYLNHGIPAYPTLARAAKSIANVVEYYEKADGH